MSFELFNFVFCFRRLPNTKAYSHVGQILILIIKLFFNLADYTFFSSIFSLSLSFSLSTAGRMHVTRGFNGKELLPHSPEPNSDQCSKPEENLYCFKAGRFIGLIVS